MWPCELSGWEVSTLRGSWYCLKVVGIEKKGLSLLAGCHLGRKQHPQTQWWCYWRTEEWNTQERKPTLPCLEPSPWGPCLGLGHPGSESMCVDRETCLEQPTHMKPEAAGTNSCQPAAGRVQNCSPKSQLCLCGGRPFCWYKENFISLDRAHPCPKNPHVHQRSTQVGTKLKL